jgi:hypothetical protein
MEYAQSRAIFAGFFAGSRSTLGGLRLFRAEFFGGELLGGGEGVGGGDFYVRLDYREKVDGMLWLRHEAKSRLHNSVLEYIFRYVIRRYSHRMSNLSEVLT